MSKNEKIIEFKLCDGWDCAGNEKITEDVGVNTAKFLIRMKEENKKLKERIKEDYKIIEVQEERINELHNELRLALSQLVMSDEIELLSGEPPAEDATPVMRRFWKDILEKDIKD